MIITNNYDIYDDNDNGIDGNKDDSDDDDLSVAADSGLMQRGVEGGESEAKEEQVDLRLSSSGMIIWYDDHHLV